MLTLTLLGLGRLGTRLGLALKRKKDIELRIIGHDLILENAKQAEKQGAIDKAEWNLPASCENADIIFLCVPLSALREVIEQVAPGKRGRGHRRCLTAQGVCVGVGSRIDSEWAALRQHLSRA